MSSDERRVARCVVDRSIGRRRQRLGKHRHRPVDLGSRLLTFERRAVLVDSGRDERIRVEERAMSRLMTPCVARAPGMIAMRAANMSSVRSDLERIR